MELRIDGYYRDERNRYLLVLGISKTIPENKPVVVCQVMGSADIEVIGLDFFNEKGVFRGQLGPRYQLITDVQKAVQEVKQQEEMETEHKKRRKKAKK